MAGLNYEEKSSFSTTIAEFMKQNQSELEKAGFIVKERIVKQNDMNEKYVTEDAKQEKMKAEVVKQTEITIVALDEMYKFASTNLDAMAGVLGKDTPLAKRLHKLRGQMSHKSPKEK